MQRWVSNETFESCEILSLTPFMSVQNPLNLCVKIVQGNWTMDVNSDVYSSALIKLVYECLDQVSESNN